MMRTLQLPPKRDWATLCQRPVQDSSTIIPRVQEIMQAVRKEGDAALLRYAQAFDGVQLQQLQVSAQEIKSVGKQVPAALQKAIRAAYNNIYRFHSSQKEKTKKITTQPGIQCWRSSRAIDSVGLYIPGGSAPLLSTVLMLGTPAQIAGCRNIVLCTPPNKEGNIHPGILFAAKLCGIHKIYKVGGAQAIAAMAYGTHTIPRVHKIFGPGNQYVTTAKQCVQQEVAIDMPAGPSEVVVIADDTANPAFVAADLLAQAEHGGDSQVVLVCTNKKIAKAVTDAVAEQLPTLSRAAVTAEALQHSFAVVVKNIAEAIAFSNTYAPEHLILACNVTKKELDNISNAGSVFIGHYTPESVGDYASGTNHTLPTNGYAHAYSGVSLDSFVKKITFQQLTPKGLRGIATTVTTLAEAEGLMAHSRAVRIRL